MPKICQSLECKTHVGKVHEVTVLNKSKLVGDYEYCENAVATDRAKGLIVVVKDDDDEDDD